MAEKTISQEKTGIMHFSSVTQFISEKAPQQLAKERAVITPGKIENWFKDFSNFMSIEVTDTTLWKEPSCWFNADESGFTMCPKSGKVLAPRGVPNVYNLTSPDKTQITVFAS